MPVVWGLLTALLGWAGTRHEASATSPFGHALRPLFELDNSALDFHQRAPTRFDHPKGGDMVNDHPPVSSSNNECMVEVQQALTQLPTRPSAAEDSLLRMHEAGDALRGTLCGEKAMMAYTENLSRWAGHYLAELWGTQTLAYDQVTANTFSVQVPTDDFAACLALSDRMLKEHGIRLHEPSQAQTEHGHIGCILTLTAQVYHEESDYKLVGDLVPQLLLQDGAYHYPPRGLPLFRVRPQLLQHAPFEALAADA